MGDEGNNLIKESIKTDNEVISENNTESEKNTGSRKDMLLNEDDIQYMSLRGYQVSHGEYFAHLFEPSVTFNKEKVAVNAACLRKLPDTTFVWFLVNPSEKKLAIKPCSEDTKDSFRWCSVGLDGKVHPKIISCKIFFGKVVKLMGWNPRYRYKILGKLKRDNDGCLFVFDLITAEEFKGRKLKGRSKKVGNTSNNTLTNNVDINGEVDQTIDSYVSSNSAVSKILGDNEDSFGIPIEEHQGNALVKIFEDDTVFKLDIAEEKEDRTEKEEAKADERDD